MVNTHTWFAIYVICLTKHEPMGNAEIGNPIMHGSLNL